MSAIQAVAEILREHGPSTWAAVAERLPHLSHRQVQRALQNGSGQGLCHFREAPSRGQCRGPVGEWAYGAADGTLPERPGWDANAPRGRLGHLGRIASVWEMGA